MKNVSAVLEGEAECLWKLWRPACLAKGSFLERGHSFSLLQRGEESRSVFPWPAEQTFPTPNILWKPSQNIKYFQMKHREAEDIQILLSNHREERDSFWSKIYYSCSEKYSYLFSTLYCTLSSPFLLVCIQQKPSASFSDRFLISKHAQCTGKAA